MILHKILATLAALSFIAFGLPARAEDAGSTAPPPHDHADHATAEPVKDESVLDYLFRKSDEAFHHGEYERVLGLQRAILALDPGDVDTYGTSAWLLWSMGRGEEALRFLDRGLKTNPNNWEMWDEAGIHYDLQHLFKEAQAAYTHALQLIPKEENSQMVRRRLAHAAEKTKDWPTALATWQALVQDFPNEPINRNNLARVEKAQTEANTAAAAATDK
jgi:tetratricopeptide (TPR) repeat protein